MKKILVVTTINRACGIADYAEQAMAAIHRADPQLFLTASEAALDPAVALQIADQYDAVWLNHHDALHAQWQPEHVRQIQSQIGRPVVVTYHDTFSGEDRENSPKARELCRVANAFIVHEPVTDLPNAILIRHGVPVRTVPSATPSDDSTFWHLSESFVTTNIQQGDILRFITEQARWEGRRILGSVGFNFPWKNFDRVAEYAARHGWALLLLSNNATLEDELRWRALNPHTLVVRRFLPQAVAVHALSLCDATIFAYECANAGTSGAIRQGIAAQKPVIAFQGCRQFRDLRLIDPPPFSRVTDEYVASRRAMISAITWIDSFEDVGPTLEGLAVQAAGSGRDVFMRLLAEQEGWPVQGRAYAAVFAEVFQRCMS